MLCTNVKMYPVNLLLLHKSCIFTRGRTSIPSKVSETFHMSIIVFSSYGGKLSEIHFPNKLKADLSAWKLSTCADEVCWKLFFPLLFVHIKAVTKLSTWSAAAAKVRLLERYSWLRDWEIKWKRAFWIKCVKTSVLVCQVSGVVPTSLHIHLSFLPMRCLCQPPPNLSTL